MSEAQPLPLPPPRATDARTTNLPHAQSVTVGSHLLKPHECLPAKFRPVFPHDTFNEVQSKCFAAAYESNDNLVVSAPTGSGKTVIMELAICRLAFARQNQNFKVVYQAPTKALCSERARDWERKFGPLGMGVAELTGDTSMTDMRRVRSASIILTTPEKWDSITRRWRDHGRLVDLVELFLVDEVHILKDERGSTLEVVVSRMKSIGASVRFVALSATVPNPDDVAKWLGRDHTNQQLPARREAFGEEHRPVKLEKFVYGYSYHNVHALDGLLDPKLPGLIGNDGDKVPALVFCSMRKSCETAAKSLGDAWMRAAGHAKPWRAPSQKIRVINTALQAVVDMGVAFHHAGLEAQDRHAVEKGFLDRELSAICCTSTLAVGVNLPCRTVILKGTATYQNGEFMEYSDLEVMQMLGRAGRPQFDTRAIAIILTRKESCEKYDKMASGQEILESTLHLNLIEHLNSEIVLRAIIDLPSAKRWISDTFLSVRLRRNPGHYKLTEPSPDAQHIDNSLEQICERNIKLLQEAGLVTKGETFAATEHGHAMSSHMVKFDTMKMILKLPRAGHKRQLVSPSLRPTTAARN